MARHTILCPVLCSRVCADPPSRVFRPRRSNRQARPYAFNVEDGRQAGERQGRAEQLTAKLSLKTDTDAPAAGLPAAVAQVDKLTLYELWACVRWRTMFKVRVKVHNTARHKNQHTAHQQHIDFAFTATQRTSDFGKKATPRGTPLVHPSAAPHASDMPK